MNRLCLYFTAPGLLSLREEPLPDVQPGQVLVRVQRSAISAGTELLVYRGLFPGGMELDANIGALSGSFGYPLKYGYSAVGQVIALGAEVDPGWQGRLVFAFQPHQSHFMAAPGELLPLPSGISADQAVFLPNMETVIGFAMDGSPLIGERVVVFGQGIVGLLTTALLARFPVDSLVTLDRYPLRRQASLQVGAHHSLDPAQLQAGGQIFARAPGGADLVYELSGAPEALDQAIALAGYSGRVVIGSWYGQKRASLDLGGRFHRSRIRLLGSQVSQIAPELSGRWSKARRFELAWEMIRQIDPTRFITQRFPIQQAAEAYRLLAEDPSETIQVVFSYD